MQIGWIDFSKKDRDKVFAVLDALSEPGAVDELGIGAIRDGFADIFFPGTSSTVQTRAKYFLLIPYILKIAMHKDRPYGLTTESILDGIDKAEKQSAERMIEAAKAAGLDSQSVGILGARTIKPGRADWLVRPPSLIYWSGLKTLEIIKGEKVKSLKTIANLISESHKNKANKQLLVNKDENEDGDDRDAYTTTALRLFADGLPYSSDWTNSLDIALTREEALFLEKRIIAARPQSLFAYLVQKNESAFGADCFAALNEILKNKDDLLPEIKDTMQLAVDFSRFMRVGFAAFNLALAGENKDNEGAIYAQGIIESEKPYFVEIAAVDLKEIFSRLKITNGGLMAFLNDLQKLMMAGDIEGLQSRCAKREYYLKKERAKVHKAGQFAKWVGLETLDYRLQRNASRILEDIKAGKDV